MTVAPPDRSAAAQLDEETKLVKTYGYSHFDDRLIANDMRNALQRALAFDKLVIYTGNIMKTGTTALQNSSSFKSNQELLFALEDTLNTLVTNPDEHSFHYNPETQVLEIPDVRYKTHILPEERSEYEVTAKLFYPSTSHSHKENGADPDPDYIMQAISHLTCLLGISTIDNFIISVEHAEDVQDIDFLYPAYKQLEKTHKAGITTHIGVSELTLPQLQTLLASTQVKPKINQVSLASCCTMPRDLVDYAEKEHIELWAHGDRDDILPRDTFTEVLHRFNLNCPSASIVPRWILKYSCAITGRGIVADKGYIIVADKR